MDPTRYSTTKSTTDTPSNPPEKGIELTEKVDSAFQKNTADTPPSPQNAHTDRVITNKYSSKLVNLIANTFNKLISALFSKTSTNVTSARNALPPSEKSLETFHQKAKKCLGKGFNIENDPINKLLQGIEKPDIKENRAQIACSILDQIFINANGEDRLQLWNALSDTLKTALEKSPGDKIALDPNLFIRNFQNEQS